MYTEKGNNSSTFTRLALLNFRLDKLYGTKAGKWPKARSVVNGFLNKLTKLRQEKKVQKLFSKQSKNKSF